MAFHPCHRECGYHTWEFAGSVEREALKNARRPTSMTQLGVCRVEGHVCGGAPTVSHLLHSAFA